MISKSIRDELNLAGQSASLKQLAHEGGQPFPLSVRNWVGAFPPGRILRKVIPLELLQRKFNEFFNDRLTPLFQFRLHGTEFGKSELTISFDKPVVGYQPFVDPLDMGYLELDLPLLPNPEYHFNNLQSEHITVNVIYGDPVVIYVQIDFETQNEEIKVNNFSNIDFKEFNLNLKLKFERSDDGAIDLLKWVNDVDDVTEYINTHVVTAAHSLDDDMVRSRVRRKINETIFQMLKEEKTRDRLKRMVTPWVVGGSFHVTSVTTDGQSLFIDYVLPLGQHEPFPEVPQTPLEPGLLSNINHIVVLMMENRSFDHMLGYLSKHPGPDGIRSDIDGLHGGEKNPYNGLDYFSFPLPGTQFLNGPCHDHDCVFTQTNGGKMDGFVADFAPRAKSAVPAIDPGEIMGYHTAPHVPVYDALAREFLICQRWFAAHPGPTFPNRFYTMTGRLNRDVDGRWQLDNPHGGTFMPVATKTIFDHLTAQGVSWRYYEHEYCFLRMFAQYTTDNSHVFDFSAFRADAAAGTLASVSFIDPDFINVPWGNDDQPPADIADGQHLIGIVVDALTNSPNWGNTLLIITYDEHGGFFDHVAPPDAPAVSGIDRYGVRLPAFVVSPWVAPGKTSNEVFDHTSILKTIIRRFLGAHPPDMGERVANAKDLSIVLQPTQRTETPHIPVPPAPIHNVALAVEAETATEGDGDFNALLRSVRSRYPVS